jgi:hypothetical protein
MPHFDVSGIPEKWKSPLFNFNPGPFGTLEPLEPALVFNDLNRVKRLNGLNDLNAVLDSG